MHIKIDHSSPEVLKETLLKDFRFFLEVFFRQRNSRDFTFSKPVSEESHFNTLIRELYDVFLLKNLRLIINMPPGWSKSTIVKYFIAWTLAHYPDSNHLYISYSHDLASTHTYDIKQIMSIPLYKHLFDIEIPRDSSAKDAFRTQYNGAVAAFGSSGAITGRDAGLPHLKRYSGAIILDDPLKPDDAHSDTIREGMIRNFCETIQPRCRGENVPIIVIAQRLHEEDLPAYLLNGKTGETWRHVNICAEDEAGNPRYPELMSREKIQTLRKYESYVYWSQYMQQPIPAGGALFKRDDFILLDEDPQILTTFVTVDTAETDKNWNDKTVFSFWGVYKVKIQGIELDSQLALQWLDCRELSIEPRDLESEFLDFWVNCMRYKVKPDIAFIEKKSTGVTLLSTLKNTPGLRVQGIERTKASGSKGARYIEMQKYISSKLVTLPTYGTHSKKCIDHMIKITANNSHRWDDICDTVYDAIRAVFIDKVITTKLTQSIDYKNVAKTMSQHQQNMDNLRNRAFTGKI